MLSPGAADGHGDITAVVLCHGFKPMRQKGLDVLAHERHICLLIQKIYHRFVLSREMA